MKTAIIYVSTHHGNTKKLADAIAAKNEITLIDATREKTVDLSGYDRIGFASGIAYGKFYPQMLKFMEENLPEGKKVFFLYTYGAKRKGYSDAAKEIALGKKAEILGEYSCPGFDTFGPFKVIGGIAKGHPTEDEIAGAVSFYDSLK